MKLLLYDTLSRSLKEVNPTQTGKVTIYNCGPTVYWKMQIGNIRAYTNWDILHRSLLYLGYDVQRAMNFTDVGHMTSDENFGEDKMEKAAAKEGKSPDQIADAYIQTILDDFSRMNFLHPNGKPVKGDEQIDQLANYGWLRATNYVNEMIEFIKKIEANGFTYETEQALYFDISKYPEYTKLSGQKLEDKFVAVRDEVNVDPQAKHPADFVLWMKKVGRYEKHIQHWESPWGVGFPGWHIECSAMGTDSLGSHITIHTGGVDHIAVHHSNERAQNYGVYGQEIVDIWVHNEFISATDGDKLSKSKGNAWTLDDAIAKGFDPLDIKYYFASINYGQPIKFSTEALAGSRNSRINLQNKVISLTSRVGADRELSEVLPIEPYQKRFAQALADNLNMSEAFAILYEMLSSDYDDLEKLATVLDFDKVLGFNLIELVSNKDLQISEDVQKLALERDSARAQKDWMKSDEIRDQLVTLGYEVLDTAEGTQIRRKL